MTDHSTARARDIDRQSREFVDAASAGPLSRITDFHPAEIRKVDAARNPVDPQARGHVESTQDRTIPGEAGAIPVRVYRPHGVQNPPVVVYFHGGGFGVGSIDVYDTFSCLLCRDSGALVVSVEYRLAPEHKFPAGLNDAYAAYRWIVENHAELGTRSDGIALVGDSAGAGLVASVTLLAKRDAFRTADFQVLVYPMLAGDLDTASRTRLSTGYYVTREMISYYMGHYVSRAEQNRDPLVSPVLATDLAGVPPALVITAEYDPLHDDGEQYARLLKEAGVDVIYTEYGKTVHGFVKRPALIEKGIVAVAQIGATLRSALGRGWD